jgi:hypothetical protein
MGLFGLMPGEWDVPQAQGGWQDRMGGILSGDNQLANIGLGILANNNSRNFGEVVGKGALYGMQQTQQNRRYAEDQKYRQAQMKRYEREDSKDAALEASHTDFDTKFPEYKGLSRLNPAAAMKIAYPNAASNTSDPYFTDRYIGGKTYAFNNRTGEYIEKDLGGSNLPNKDDPSVQFPVSAAKSAGDNLYQVTDKKDGFLMPMTNLAIESGAPPLNFLPQQQPQQLPQINPQQLPQLPQGAPVFPSQLPQNGSPQSMQIPPELQQQRDGVRKQMLLAEQAQYGGQGANPSLDAEIANMNGLPQRQPQSGGLRVPTKAEQAAAAETAKLKAENTVKSQQDLPRAIANAETALKQIDELVGSADGTIKEHAGFRTAVGTSSKIDPRNYLAGTDATSFNNRLDQLKGGSFLQAFSDLRGAGAITEKEGEKATVAIQRMNTATTEDEFITAARDYQNAIKASLTRSKAKAGDNSNIMPKGEPMPSAKKAPMKGQVVGGYKFKGGNPADPNNWTQQ